MHFENQTRCLLAAFIMSCGCAPQQDPGAADSMNAHQLAASGLENQIRGDDIEASSLSLLSGVRGHIDRQVYVSSQPAATSNHAPTLTGSNSSQASMHRFYRDPLSFSLILQRVREWQPRFSSSYDPGWDYDRRLSAHQAEAVAKSAIAELLPHMDNQLNLLRNPEYRSNALRVALAEKDIVRLNGLGSSRDLEVQISQAAARRQVAFLRLLEIQWDMLPDTRWHQRSQWNAQTVFDDPLVIELCYAIERDNAPEIEEWIEFGADVNTVGQTGLTPLMWAFPDLRLKRVEVLLKHGADPNVICEAVGTASAWPMGLLNGHFPEPQLSPQGNAVIHLAAASPSVELLDMVLEAGGDINLENALGMAALELAIATHRLQPGNENPSKERVVGKPTDNVVIDREAADFHDPNMIAKVRLLLDAGADPNHISPCGSAAFLAARVGRSDVIKILIDAGADPNLASPLTAISTLQQKR